MQLSEFLDFDAIKSGLPGGNKRSLLQQLAQLAAQRLGVDAAPVLASLSERERLGSTGFGQGVAIPHGKVDGLERIYALFARLAEPIDYKGRRGAGRSDLLLLSAPERGRSSQALAAITLVPRHAPRSIRMRGARAAMRSPQCDRRR